jgi:hypothetical protein
MNRSLDILKRLTEGVDYSNNLTIFNQILTEWDFIQDYIGQDITEPYLAGVSIDGDKIGISCELWDPDIDDFVSVSGGDFEAPEIVNAIKNANFDSTADIYAEAKPIYYDISNLIDWNKVSDDLYSELHKQKEELGEE